MKSLIVTKEGKLKIEEINRPVYGKYQALVKTIACGMCGTDVKLIHKTFKGFPESMYPVILGHEGVGEVIETGEGVTSFKKGDKVLLPFVDADEKNIPGYGSAWGALSEYAVVCDPAAPDAPDCAFAQNVLPEDIDPVDAVMIVTFREVLSSIKVFGIKENDTIAVFGCGPVGLTYIKFMSLLGVKNIIACDIIPERLAKAAENGAAYMLNGKEQDVEKEVRKIYPEGVDFVLDAAGFPSIVNQGMALIKDRGTVLCYGVPEKEEITIDFSKADYNWSVKYQQMPKKREEGAATAQIIEWLREGKINLKDYISDYFKFEDSVEAYEKMLAKKILKKGIIVF